MENAIQIPIKSLSKAIRLQNLIIVVFAQYFTAIFLSSPAIEFQSILTNVELLLLSFSTVLIAAAGYLINDYYDIKIDLVNRPDEVVIGTNISRRVALFLHIILNSTGILIGTYLSIYIGIIHLFSATLLWWYSNYWKRQPLIGNLMISFLTGLSIYLVSFLYPENRDLILDYSLFAAVMTLIREIIKDMEDVVGDKRYGSHTLPIIWGMRKTKRFIYFLIITYTILMFFLSYYHMHELWFIILSIFLVLMLVLLRKVYQADTKRKYSWLSQYCKFVMLIGVLTMILIHPYL